METPKPSPKPQPSEVSSDCSPEVATTSSKRSETAMTNTKHTTPQIPVKDIYSVRDAAILLGTTEDRVRELASREVDPLPFRCFPDRMRGMFILRSEFAAWVKAHTMPVCQRKRGAARDDSKR